MNNVSPKRVTPRQAIAEQCASCNYDPLDKGTKFEQIQSCMITTCPLYAFRPKTAVQRTALREEKIKAMSESQLTEYALENERKTAGLKGRKKESVKLNTSKN